MYIYNQHFARSQHPLRRLVCIRGLPGKLVFVCVGVRVCVCVCVSYIIYFVCMCVWGRVCVCV